MLVDLYVLSSGGYGLAQVMDCLAIVWAKQVVKPGWRPKWMRDG
jgi:hypothetical protein